MKLLAIETATLEAGVALMDDTHLIAEYRFNAKMSHTERLLAAIDTLLTGHDTPVPDLNAIAISMGPGSFTGLRVGLATAKGLALATSIPLIPISTFEAMAATFPYSHHRIVPLLTAKRGEVYWASFLNPDQQPIRLQADTVSPIVEALDQIASWIEKREEPILFVGEGALQHKDLILKRFEKRALFPPRMLQFPLVSAVAEIGFSCLLKGEVVSCDQLLPLDMETSFKTLKQAL